MKGLCDEIFQFLRYLIDFRHQNFANLLNIHGTIHFQSSQIWFALILTGMALDNLLLPQSWSFLHYNQSRGLVVSAGHSWSIFLIFEILQLSEFLTDLQNSL